MRFKPATPIYFYLSSKSPNNLQLRRKSVESNSCGIALAARPCLLGLTVYCHILECLDPAMVEPNSGWVRILWIQESEEGMVVGKPRTVTHHGTATCV